jgi:hypothetical protein
MSIVTITFKDPVNFPGKTCFGNCYKCMDLVWVESDKTNDFEYLQCCHEDCEEDVIVCDKCRQNGTDIYCVDHKEDL